MRKYYIIVLPFFLFQVYTFAQFGFSADNHWSDLYPGKSGTTVNINLDSLMLDSIITKYKNTNQIPGIATLIIKDNQIVWDNNYGYRNVALQSPVEDSTFFLIASISKTIVATAVMQLWENGMINLENNINNYLPPGFTVVNPYYLDDSITVKMLMVHTSSLQDNWFQILNPLDICGDSPIALDTFLINYFSPGGTYYRDANFYNDAPGQTYNYSNTAVSLLALIVENLTGKSFDEYCRDSIFTPLSMNSSSWFLEGMDTSKIAVPYLDPSHPLCHKGWPPYPSVFLRTNKLELSNLLSAYINKGVFNNHRILDSTTITYMLSDQLGSLINDGTTVQGLIWFKFLPFVGSVWGHNGEWDGCETYMGFDPVENYGVVWFQNWSEGSAPYIKLIEVNYYFTKYASLYGHIYAVRPNVDKTYAMKNIDSVLFRTKFSNIYNHTFTPHLIYANSDSTFIDSLLLFDDGLHGDSLAGDGIYGAYIPPQQTENFFRLDVGTSDNQTGEYYNTPDLCRFTTAGPVTLDSVSITLGSGGNYFIRPFVTNKGTELTIPNAKIRHLCNDPWVPPTDAMMSLPDLPPGESIGTSGWFIQRYTDSLFSGYFNLKFKILSDEYPFWEDTIHLIVIPDNIENEKQQPLIFALNQNYPNPFNPATKIKYSIQEPSKVTLKVYDVLGREIATLINENKSSGTYELNWNAANLPSGVYLYQLRATPGGGQAGSFTAVKKMLLLK